jgi:uncharacterized protein DUF4437
MKKRQMGIVALVLLAAVSLSLARADKNKGMKAQTMTGRAGQSHTLVTPNEIKWGPGPSFLPAGAQMAVLDGDPSKAGRPFTLRLKMPDGYKVPPHWHPVDENVTTLEGVIMMGVGEKFDQAATHEMPVGAYAKMPKGLRHYASARGETTIQVHGVGPFEITYVNPADDPRKLTKRQ